MSVDHPFHSIYLHLPFCRRRCTYCDFNSSAGQEHLIAPYLEALRREIEVVGRSANHSPLPVHTLYFGGGTPSLLTTEQIAALIDSCRSVFALDTETEITLEANPGTVNAAQLHAYRAAGITRLSLGVQSVDPQELALLGRIHTHEEAVQAFRLARKAGFTSLSVDLIYGLPRQKLATWRKTLDTILDWQPDHLSVYSLSLEPGTSLHQQVTHNKLPDSDPDQAADMYDLACDQLAQAGLQQAELSNWARPGHHCRHNHQYWRNLPYLGFGAGAHGSLPGKRYWNIRPIEGYIERIRAGGKMAFPCSPAVEGQEAIDRPTAMAETVILGLRLVREGVSKVAFAERFGVAIGEVYGELIAELVSDGWLEEDAQALRLTRRAYLVSNQIFLRFLPD